MHTAGPPNRRDLTSPCTPFTSRGIEPALPITGGRRNASMLRPDLLTCCFLVIPIDPTRVVEYLKSGSSGAEGRAGGE
jgi:hypothetical protein